MRANASNLVTLLEALDRLPLPDPAPTGRGHPRVSSDRAIDSTVIRAHGGVWHKQDREANIVPHSSLDTEAHWTKSGWHGWVDGWKLHLIVSVGPVWLPLAADVTPANAADNAVAFGVLDDLTTTVRSLLGDLSDNDPALREACDDAAITLITSRRGPHPHRDGGVDVRRVFHALRSTSIEKWNGQFTAIVAVNQPVPTRGRMATRRWVLGAIFVYQLTVLGRFEAAEDLRTGLKPFLKAA